ncbi:MAG: 3-deoxy-D-manno-octulosonic acid transferase [Helicobacteraceae bacterium]|jgi:3-deoxy-D-manno-octulosonic-acid transferase|nr:3-deoxy-D-manno-octulosonic acid transferase [Helicobacteraceae bacterium]
MFNFFYLFLSWSLYLVFLPFLLLASVYDKKIRVFVFKRMLLVKNPPFTKKGVWIHCASFGEARAVFTIVSSIGGDVNITVATKAGFDEARRLYPNAQTRYLPFENLLPFWTREQKALIVFDAELWYELFRSAKKRGAKTALFNARVPDKSVKTYRRFRFLFFRIFSFVDHIYAQGGIDKERLLELGAKKADILGNIKLAQKPKIKRLFDKPPDGIVTVAASTHEGEERLILEAWRESGIGGKILIAPRHSDRFSSVYSELKKDCGVALFSETKNLEASVVLVDQLGILNELYAIADIAVLGGSFTLTSGHNPLEPLFLGCTIVSGEGIEHQRSLFDEIEGVIFANKYNLKEKIRLAQKAEKPRLKNSFDCAGFERALKNVL